jgi:hypothetical protein
MASELVEWRTRYFLATGVWPMGEHRYGVFRRFVVPAKAAHKRRFGRG